MTYVERHRNDKTLKGARTGKTKPARSSNLPDEGNEGMIKKTIDGLRYNDEIDYDSPESSLKV